MNINEFARLVAKAEGKKKQVDIAQIKEMLRAANQALTGGLYSAIRGLKPVK